MSRQPVLFVALDDTTDVERTMNVALGTAKAIGAEIRTIHVVPHDAVPVDHRRDRAALGSDADRGGGIGERLASARRFADRDGVRVRSVTLRGTPEHAIPAYAQLDQPTALVVERDYGSSAFWRNVGVVDELARRSPVPLLVLPPRHTLERDTFRLRHILTPFDFSIASAIALRTAIDLSRRHGSRVTLLHALTNVPPQMVFSGSQAWDIVQRLPAQKDAVAARLRRKAAFFGAHAVDTTVAMGMASGAILKAIAQGNADLVVIGVAYRSWLDRTLLGSTLRRVLRRAPVPLLVVPVVAGAHTWSDDLVGHEIRSHVLTDSAIDIDGVAA
jgi:nucleotide-binding universal stress UspA family protein